jgi:hypothetical protein
MDLSFDTRDDLIAALATLRIQRGMSRTRLGRAAGVKPRDISDYEKGRKVPTRHSGAARRSPRDPLVAPGGPCARLPPTRPFDHHRGRSARRLGCPRSGEHGGCPHGSPSVPRVARARPGRRPEDALGAPVPAWACHPSRGGRGARRVSDLGLLRLPLRGERAGCAGRRPAGRGDRPACPRRRRATPGE